MSLELPLKADLNDAPTVNEYKAAIGAQYDFIDSGFFDPATGAGSADVQTVAAGETGYKNGRIYRIKPGATNTGACTYNFDGLGAKNVKLISGADPYAGAITSGVPADFLYDGTNLVLLNPCRNSLALTMFGLTVTAAELNILDGMTAAMIPRILHRTSTVVTVANTTSETEILNYTVPANTLGTLNKIQVTANCSIVHNHDAGGASFTFKAYYGATLIASNALVTDATNSASARPFKIQLDLYAVGATNTQKALTLTHYSEFGDAEPTTNNVGEFRMSNDTSIAEDSTGALDLRFTITHITANANQSVRLHEATIMLFPG
jgi:hypothetical protein